MFRQADQDIEMQNLAAQKEERRKASARNGLLDSIIAFIDNVDLGAIYVMFLKPVLHKFLEETGKYFMFPIAAAASLIRAALAWRQVYIDRGKSRSVVTAAVETVTAVAITVAVVGALAASAVFAVATPIIFTAVMAGKTLFHAGSAIYYAGKAAAHKEPAKKAKYRELAKKNAIGTVAGIVATAAVATVFLFGKIALAGIGIAAAVIGGTLAVIKGYKSFKASQAAPAAAPSTEDVAERGEAPRAEPGLSPVRIARGLNVSREDLTARVEEGRLRKSGEHLPTGSQSTPVTVPQGRPEEEQPLLGRSFGLASSQ